MKHLGKGTRLSPVVKTNTVWLVFWETGNSEKNYMVVGSALAKLTKNHLDKGPGVKEL